MVAASFLLVLAASAYSASGKRYRGRTSQGLRISLRLSGGFVRKLDYEILDKCPGGQRLRNHDFNFPPLAVHRSRFGGRFADGKAATVIVKGRVRRRTVSGSLMDRVKDRRTHEFCHGRAKFRLR